LLYGFGKDYFKLDMNLNSAYISPVDVALSNFVKALALPVRICIVRFILENGNAVKRNRLSEIPYNPTTVHQHINELRNLDIVKADIKDKETIYSVNETIFIKMSNHFLTLFEHIKQLNEEADEVFSKPKLKKQPTKKPVKQLSAFGEYVREKRKAAGLSQADLAERVKMDRAWVSKIETNKQPVRAEKLHAFAEALNTSLTEMREIYYRNKINDLTKEGLSV